jgi:hypothetical protein
MESQNNEHLPWELSSQLVSMMTTEHYTLQTGYAISTSEVNGRSSLFVGAVSSALIALAFVGQISHLGTAFFVFSLVVIPTLLFMGLITFERTLQANSATLKYARGMNRIRHLYLEYAPQMKPYFILSSHDDMRGILGDMGVTHPHVWWEGFFSAAFMIAMITSVLAGSFVGLLLAAITLPLAVTTSAGVVAFLVSVGLHLRYQWRKWVFLNRNQPILFPSQPGEEKRPHVKS